MDKLKSYEAAKNQMLKSVEHRYSQEIEQPLRRTRINPLECFERRMRSFKSPGQAQRFLSAFGQIRDHFHPRQHQLTAHRYREQMRQRFQDWHEIVGLKPAA